MTVSKAVSKASSQYTLTLHMLKYDKNKLYSLFILIYFFGNGNFSNIRVNSNIS